MILPITRYPTGPAARALLALYTDRQKGERAGTWRFFRVLEGVCLIVEADL